MLVHSSLKTALLISQHVQPLHTYNSPFSPFFAPSCCRSLIWLPWSVTFCLSAAMLLSPELARSSRHRPLPSFCSFSCSCFFCSSSSGERFPSSFSSMRGVVESARRVMGEKEEAMGRKAEMRTRGAMLMVWKGYWVGGCLRMTIELV